ncbi:unnamed protein product, partial [Brenthis ino]
MECQPSDSKKLFKVFDASKRKRTRKKRDGDDSNSMATDDSTGGCQGNGRRVSSAKTSLQDISAVQGVEGKQENVNKRERDSSPSMTRSPVEVHRPRSPRRHRRIAREGISLALKAGLVSTPRSISPNPQEGEDAIGSVPKDQDSFIYAFLEEAIKRDKKKHRHTKRHEERDVSQIRERQHHHRRHRDNETRDRDKLNKYEAPKIDQATLFETFAKLCAQMNQKSPLYANANDVPRSQSHKSLQCEVVSRRESFEADQRPIQLRSRDLSRDNMSPSRMRSHDHFNNRIRSHDNIAVTNNNRNEKCGCCEPYDKQQPKYSSKTNVAPGKYYDDDRYHDCPPQTTPTRSCLNGHYKTRAPDRRDIRDYDDQRRKYDERRRLCEQKASRSFEIHRDGYVEDERSYRRTARSDGVKDKRYDERDYKDRKYEDRGRDKYYEEKEKNYASLPAKDRRSRRNLERFENMSIASRDDNYRDRDRDRDRYSERERDSGLSVADGETSTVSGRSNYLRVVKQEISEQREAMDKMMKLWKELMRCFKGVSQVQGTDKTNETAASMRDSAAAQLRLWRECMRRYETVARDVGDTDARLMLATSESPTRMAAPPLVCAEGEGPPAAPHYRMPYNYPPMPPIPPGYPGGSPLRSRVSAPPAWWWTGEGQPESPRRRSSPDSRGSRDRRHRHKDRDRDDSRYKEKSKPSGARSEHRHRKR